MNETINRCKHCGILERYHSATGPCDYYEAEITAEDIKQRRERIATALMAGLWANPDWSNLAVEKTIQWALSGAETLIKALDEVKK